MTHSEPLPPADSTATAQALRAEHERRLHPWSWLFVLLYQLRQYAMPLIVLLLFGRGGGEWWESLGIVFAVVLALGAVLRYWTYRFRIDAGELVIRSGVLQRNVRHIPLARIQNVVLRRNPLHRLFGVADVRLESAVGGKQAEAEMQVLSQADAEALEALVRQSRQSAGDDSAIGAAAPAEAAREVLLQLPLAELLRLGLISNRGVVAVMAAVGVLSQASEGMFVRMVQDFGERVFGYAQGMGLERWQYAAMIVLLLMAVAALMRVLSIAIAVLRFYGFELSQDDGRLSVEAGLLTRLRQHTPLSKVQRWWINESLLHRWFSRRSLSVETAAVAYAEDAHGSGEIVPLAPPRLIDELLSRWRPRLGWPSLPWQRLHPLAWWRMFVQASWIITAAAIPLCVNFGAWGLLVFLAVPWGWLRARRYAAHARWLLTDEWVGWRGGWLNRHWCLVERARVQAVRLQQSPFDRRRGMASLLVDTAGGGSLVPPLRLRYLPEADARRVFDALRRG